MAAFFPEENGQLSLFHWTDVSRTRRLLDVYGPAEGEYGHQTILWFLIHTPASYTPKVTFIVLTALLLRRSATGISATSYNALPGKALLGGGFQTPLPHVT